MSEHIENALKYLYAAEASAGALPRLVGLQLAREALEVELGRQRAEELRDSVMGEERDG